MVCIRKRRDNAVIGDRNRLVPPLSGAGDDILDIRDAVHIAHLCMAVQLHSFDRSQIHPFLAEARNLYDPTHGANGDIMVKTVQ